MEIDIFFHKSNASTFYVSLNLYSVLKSRDIANKGQYSQGHGLPRGHVQLWEPDRKECRTSKNRYLQTVVLEETPESPLESKEITPVNLKRNKPWYLEQLMLKLKFQHFGHLMWTGDWVPDAEKDWGHKEKRASEGAMAGWCHQCNGSELGQTSGDGEGQGGPACSGLWGCIE